MLEFSNERVEQILHQETLKTEELATILRAIYTRYMRMYERIYADIEALNDAEIAKLREYHEETRSLVKYYYMDIPVDICTALNEFDDKDCAKLLGPDWQEFLHDRYMDFKDDYLLSGKSETELKAEFADKCLDSFYEEMGSAFRAGFGSGSITAENLLKGIKHLAFGKEEE